MSRGNARARLSGTKNINPVRRHAGAVACPKEGRMMKDPDPSERAPHGYYTDEGIRARLIEHQPGLRLAATLLENFRACPLPKCRRAKRCLGWHPPETYGDNFYNRFPPCISDADGQSRLMGFVRDYVARHPDPEDEAPPPDGKRR
jgi:hypothetical protein